MRGQIMQRQTWRTNRSVSQPRSLVLPLCALQAVEWPRVSAESTMSATQPRSTVGASTACIAPGPDRRSASAGPLAAASKQCKPESTGAAASLGPTRRGTFRTRSATAPRTGNCGCRFGRRTRRQLVGAMTRLDGLCGRDRRLGAQSVHSAHCSKRTPSWFSALTSMTFGSEACARRCQCSSHRDSTC